MLRDERTFRVEARNFQRLGGVVSLLGVAALVFGAIASPWWPLRLACAIVAAVGIVAAFAHFSFANRIARGPEVVPDEALPIRRRPPIHRVRMVSAGLLALWSFMVFDSISKTSQIGGRILLGESLKLGGGFVFFLCFAILAWRPRRENGA